MVEHGYHVFPKWYPNVRAIVDRIGVRLIDFDRYHFLLPGQYPNKVTVMGPSGLRRCCTTPSWTTAVVSQRSLLVLRAGYDQPAPVGKELPGSRQSDRPDSRQMVHQRVGCGVRPGNVLKASAIPIYDLSAMTAKRVSSYWVRQGSPFLSVLPGDLQTVFIEPQVRELEALGVDIRYESDVTRLVTRDGAIAAVALRDGTELSADAYAVCTPFEVTRTWLDDSLYAADPELGNLHFLEAQPMAALHLRLRKQLPDLPREHVFFHGGQYALSLIDVGRFWKELEGKAELSFISSNYAPLNNVSKDKAKDLLLEEIGEYLPITPADVESWELNTNTDVPLFINTIGAWPNRPRPKSAIPNLYLAGDYVRNAIDLACMEGAVSAALEAAGQILRDHGETESVPAAQVPPVWPRACWCWRASS